jgi:formylglycine-generating enzyme required for sulfatase activity
VKDQALSNDGAPEPDAASAGPLTREPEPSEASAPPVPPGDLKETFTNSIGMTLRLIPAGEFEMGSADPDREAGGDEKPRHRVRINRPFYLGATEVTVGQFRRFVEETKYRTEAERSDQGGHGWDSWKGAFVRNPRYTWRSPGFSQGDKNPVVLVSWNDAVEFCAWLGRKDGGTYRLPTEAEWEYAARAGTTGTYWPGDDPEALAQVGNIADGSARKKHPDWKTIAAKDGYIFTSEVGHYQRPNPWGLHDVHGNVWEWCSDLYQARYYAVSRSNDPKGPAPGPANRVIRGGSWYNIPRTARSAHRGHFAPASQSSNLGFRVARDP